MKIIYACWEADLFRILAGVQCRIKHGTDGSLLQAPHKKGPTKYVTIHLISCLESLVSRVPYCHSFFAHENLYVLCFMLYLSVLFSGMSFYGVNLVCHRRQYFFVCMFAMRMLTHS